MPEAIHVVLEQSPTDYIQWLKDFGAPLVALLVALISNVVLWLKIRADSKAAIRTQLTLSRIKSAEENLAAFYDPLLALIRLNRTIFESIGPKTFPEDINLKNEAAKVWNLAVDEFVVPTNTRICELILSKSHLLSKNADTLASEFLTHAHSYAIFRKQGNVVHRSFPYPKEFEPAIEHERNLIMNQLHEAKKQFTNG